MSMSDDVMDKAKYTKEIISAMEHVAINKHMWLKCFGADSEPQVDLIIKEASDKAEDIVAMSDEDFLEFMKEKSLKTLKDIIAGADDIGVVDDDEEEEFENERRENGNLKERIS